jgi:hypothetical protein
LRFYFPYQALDRIEVALAPEVRQAQFFFPRKLLRLGTFTCHMSQGTEFSEFPLRKKKKEREKLSENSSLLKCLTVDISSRRYLRICAYTYGMCV